jgi:hypothetical protein
VPRSGSARIAAAMPSNSIFDADPQGPSKQWSPPSNPSSSSLIGKQPWSILARNASSARTPFSYSELSGSCAQSCAAMPQNRHNNNFFQLSKNSLGGKGSSVLCSVHKERKLAPFYQTDQYQLLIFEKLSHKPEKKFTFVKKC